MTKTTTSLIKEASAEATRMLRAVEGAAPDQPVTISVALFQKQANYIRSLCELVASRGEDTFALDSFWVPLPHLEKVTQQLQAVIAECDELRAVHAFSHFN